MDLYHIPGDSGGSWRLKKFVEYQHEVPSIHYRVMGNYIIDLIEDPDDAVMMCWYMSATYNEVTCILLEKLFDWRSLTPGNVCYYCEKFWEETKPFLDFGSSRKYAKNMDWFPVLMEKFVRKTHKHPYRWIKSICKGTPEENYKDLYKEILSIQYTGRFAADLFMESILYIQRYLHINLIEPSRLDWKRCSNLTSGVLNIFYYDEEANLYDKTRVLPVSEDFLTEKLEKIQRAIEIEYPDQQNDINLFVGKICSFRNLFKSARYGGFHHDRELGVLKQYEKILPEYRDLWQEVYQIRKQMFPSRFLGELNGWNGIRKERKKLWLERGLTGVEEDSCECPRL